MAGELQSLVRVVYALVSRESRCFDGRREQSGSQDNRENVEGESSVAESSATRFGAEISGRATNMSAYRR